MMREQDHIDPVYSADILRKYLEGKLSDAEMHSLEKAAMDDPMLADALEGMQWGLQHSGTDTLRRDMHDLNQRFRSRINQGRRKTTLLPVFARWQAAAAVILLVGTIGVTYTLINSRQGSGQLAVNPAKTPVSAGAVADSVSGKIPSLAAPGSKTGSVAVVSEKRSKTAFAPPAVRPAASAGEMPERNAEQPKTELRKIQDYAHHESAAGSGSRQVTDSIIGNPDSVSKNSLAVQSAETPHAKALLAEPKRKSAQPLSEVVVLSHSTQMKPDVIDDEDEVTDTGSLKKGEKVRVEKAIPASGWKTYNEYLNANKKITTADSLLRGVEIVSFMVDNKGVMSSFKVEKSLSPAHDAESIRLIKNGPPWKLLMGKKVKATASIPY